MHHLSKIPVQYAFMKDTELDLFRVNAVTMTVFIYVNGAASDHALAMTAQMLFLLRE